MGIGWTITDESSGCNLVIARAIPPVAYRRNRGRFYGSVIKTDYVALRLGFITTHCMGNPKFNFNKFKPPRDIFVYPQINAIIFLLMILLDDQDAYNMCTCNLQDSRIALVYVDHCGGVFDEAEEVLALPSSQEGQGVDNNQHHESVDGVHGVGANADASVNGVHGVGANAELHEDIDGPNGDRVDIGVDNVELHEDIARGSGDRVAIVVENVEEDSDSGSDFHDTEITNDDERDDAMFNENIDTYVESSKLGSVSKENDPTEDCIDETEDCEFDELNNLNGSDEDNWPPTYEVFDNSALDFTDAKHIKDPDFNVETIFSSKSEFKEAVHMHGVKYENVICFRRSEEKKIKVVCKKCPWFVYASVRQNDTTW
ncbi:hypothetical protein RJ639_009022 [Escallonia herrerae]|uniref:Transposase MuDR plant domain-containing protein n=1 Tax=Escallonia herrerae TaxID=1293975 RepID=A0AA89AUA0_9ASTE|nr:hypothetical protein RJ639_009022 [Escallonia herrerae]